MELARDSLVALVSSAALLKSEKIPHNATVPATTQVTLPWPKSIH